VPRIANTPNKVQTRHEIVTAKPNLVEELSPLSIAAATPTSTHSTNKFVYEN